MDYTFEIIKTFATLAPKLIKGKNDVFKKHALLELNSVYETLGALNEEKDMSLDLTTMRGHLESAIPLFKESISTWNIWDKDKILYKQYTEFNKLCVLLACVHNKLGNTEMCRKTILTKMSCKGTYEFTLDDIHNVDKLTPSKLLYCSKYFYLKLLDDAYSYSQFEKSIIIPSDNLWNSFIRSDIDDDIDLMRIHMDL